jgi:hypothetical protein
MDNSFLGLGETESTWYIGTAYCSSRGWWWLCSNRWNENWQGKPKYPGKTCPSAALSTTNAAWPDTGSNPGRCGGKQTTNRLSSGTAEGITLPPPSSKQAQGYVLSHGKKLAQVKLSTQSLCAIMNTSQLLAKFYIQPNLQTTVWIR